MAEQILRPPLGPLPISRPSANVFVSNITNSASKSNKRTYDHIGPDANAVKNGTKTPTKNCTTTAANGRKSVKRVKAEVNENPEATTVRLRTNAEAEYAAKMKAWVASYKKQFPYLRFFFDACPEEDVRRCTRRITALGGVSLRSLQADIDASAYSRLVYRALLQQQCQCGSDDQRATQGAFDNRKS